MELETKNKYHLWILFGTFITLVGILMWTWFKLNVTFSLSIIMIGKLMIVVIVYKYVSYRKIIKGKIIRRRKI